MSIRARIGQVIISEVAKFACFTPPFHVSNDEIKAYEARRRAFGARLRDAVSGLLRDNDAHDREVLSALGRVLYEEITYPKQGEPQVSSMVSRTRNLVEAETGESEKSPTCRECRRTGGCPRYLEDKHPREPQPVFMDGLCHEHYQVYAYRSWQKAYDEQTPLRATGAPPVFPPSKPASLLPRQRFSKETEDWIGKRLDRILADEEARERKPVTA